VSDELRYIVRRFNWRWAGPCFIRAPGEIRVAWLDTAADAEAERLRRETDARAKVNPFRCGPAFHYLSTFPEPVFRDWLQDADIDPPTGTGPTGTGIDVWATWWERAGNRLSANKKSRVWDGLNRVRFHDVIVRQPCEIGYAVVRVMWYWNDEPFDECNSESGGGEPLVVFRSRHRAEQELIRRSRELRSQVHSPSQLEWYGGWRDPDRWHETGRFPETRLDAADAPLFEIVEMDLFASGGDRV
jgi:hypothetical protein